MRKGALKLTSVCAAVALALSLGLLAGCNGGTLDKPIGGDTNTSATGFTYDPTTDSIGFNTGDYPLTDEESRLVALVEKAADTVVEITTSTVTTDSFMRQYVTTGAGSGVVITSTGIIITNNHVIDGADTVTVKLRSGDEYDATVLASDEIADIAVVKIDATGLKSATFGDSDKLRVGQTAVAIGNPLGSLGGSVTEGIISATGREIYVEDIPMTLLQTTAAINPGNSGGGLFNLQGDLIGVVNAKSSGSGIEGLGFAIPSNKAYATAVDLLTNGYVTGRPDVGFKTVAITDNFTLNYNGLQYAGVYVQSTTAAAPADVKVRDLIVSIDGAAIADQSDFNKALYAAEVGNTLKCKLYRTSTGKTITVDVPVIQYLPSTYSAA